MSERSTRKTSRRTNFKSLRPRKTSDVKRNKRTREVRAKRPPPTNHTIELSTHKLLSTSVIIKI